MSHMQHRQHIADVTGDIHLQHGHYRQVIPNNYNNYNNVNCIVNGNSRSFSGGSNAQSGDGIQAAYGQQGNVESERYPRHVVYPYPWTVYPYTVPSQHNIQPPPSPLSSSSISPTLPAGPVRHQRYGSPRSLTNNTQPYYPSSNTPHMPSPGLPPAHESPVLRNTGGNGLTASPVQVDAQSENTVKEHCDAMFRHPLFPLLRLLLEKLEEATSTAVTPTPETINTEMETVARRIQQNHSSITTSNPDIDDLMVQGVKVLRLHLFELEKVNELCRDFCNRYAECLRRNLHTDQILRTDGMDGDDSNQSIPTPHNGIPVHHHHPSLQHLPLPNSPDPPMYHMPQDPHGVAQHLPISVPVSPIDQHSLRNSDTLSVNEMMSLVATHSPFNDDKFDDPDDSSSPKGNRSTRRGILPKEAINVMKTWLFQHIVHPYPTEDEKRLLATQTRLSMLQVNNWFINARRRILQPMLDATNPTGASGTRPKKGIQSRPVDPFWSETSQPSAPLPASSKRPYRAQSSFRKSEENLDDCDSSDEELTANPNQLSRLP